MHCTLATLIASAALAAANTVTFMSLDDTPRTVYFTPNAGMPSVPSVDVPGRATVTADIPDSWIGNFYSISEGKPNVPGMLGEVAYQGWNGITYFDVSAIVDPNDHDGVKEMWPASSSYPTSGCKQFPCNNAYYLPDDIQTKTTNEVDLVCTLGSGAAARDFETKEDDSPSVGRGFVVGQN